MARLKRRPASLAALRCWACGANPRADEVSWSSMLIHGTYQTFCESCSADVDLYDY